LLESLGMAIPGILDMSCGAACSCAHAEAAKVATINIEVEKNVFMTEFSLLKC
jgi:hypothetical protein